MPFRPCAYGQYSFQPLTVVSVSQSTFIGLYELGLCKIVKKVLSALLKIQSYDLAYRLNLHKVFSRSYISVFIFGRYQFIFGQPLSVRVLEKALISGNTEIRPNAVQCNIVIVNLHTLDIFQRYMFSVIILKLKLDQYTPCSAQ